MKTDSYTKFILTVIAFCLLLNLAQGIHIFPNAYASESDMSNPLETNIDYALVPISDNNTIDVRLVDINTYDELNVNLKGVDTYDEMKVNLKRIETSDELDVNIDEIGGSWLSSGGPIKVKVE